MNTLDPATEAGAKVVAKRIENAVAGRNKLKIRRGRLDAGRYKVKARATDLDGVTSPPAKARVSVRD